MQDVIDKVKSAEHRTEQVERRLHEHERDAATLLTRVAVLEGRYSDLKQTLDGVVQTQGAQGERLAGIVSDVKSLREDVRAIMNRVWAGSAIGAGGTGLGALLIWFLSERGG